MHFLGDYGLFVAKIFTFVIAILLLAAGLIAIISKGRHRGKARLEVKYLNQKYQDMRAELNEHVLNKPDLKKFAKKQEKAAAAREKHRSKKRIFLLDFEGDLKASAVASLREEVTAILNIATPADEVIIRLESAGGMVHTYGLAAAQLTRLRQRNIPLIVSVDKVAASGGYLMACIANKIIAAPFAIIGSIGVITQLPNFHRLLKKHDIDYEQIMAGDFKRTLTIFGENTDSGRQKLQEEVEDIHQKFKQHIIQYRPDVNIQQVATGEHWLAIRALELKLVDELITSDDYLLSASKQTDIYEVKCLVKKSLSEKLALSVQMTVNKLLLSWYQGIEQGRFR